MLTHIARKKGGSIFIPVPADMARAAEISDGTVVAYEMFGNKITIAPASAAKQVAGAGPLNNGGAHETNTPNPQ